jgi:Dockerin type I domain
MSTRTQKTMGALIALSMATAAASAGSTDMEGKVTVAVGAGVSGVEFKGRNKTNREIHDFTFEIGEDCGRDIVTVKVVSTQNGGAGDWDVDDDADTSVGSNEGADDKDDADSSPGRVTRVDNSGDGEDNTGGDEANPQNKDGKAIDKNKYFTITITFSGPTTGSCNLCITPTNENNIQLASVTDGGLGQDGTALIALKPAFVPGVGTAMVNATGQDIVAVALQPLGDFGIVEVLQLDPITNDYVQSVLCDLGPECFVELAFPTAPGELLLLDMFFEQMSPEHESVVQINPITIPGPITGACCTADGGCQDQVADFVCLDGGGTNWAPFASCSDVLCPLQPVGSCCLYDGGCEDSLTETDCFNADGLAFNPFGGCADAICPSFGACCSDDQGCFETDAAECQDFGTFLGAGTYCGVDGDVDDETCQNQCDGTSPRIINDASLGVDAPCSGYIDPRAESTDGVGLDLGLDTVTLVFDRPVRDIGTGSGGLLTTAAFEIRETGDNLPPQVIGLTTSIDPLGFQVAVLSLDRPISVQEWTTIQAHVEDTCGQSIDNQGDLGPGVIENDRVDYGFLPADINQDGTVTPFDLLAFRLAINEGTQSDDSQCGLQADYVDTNRDGVVTPFDLLALRQLINGSLPATRIWAGETINHPQP